MAEGETTRYWKSLEERDATDEFLEAARDEFPEPLPSGAVQLDRRGFLRAAGFAVAALSSCQRAPVEKAVPYLVKPEEITPGRAYHYASTCEACPAGCGLLVKNRDGRPVKLEGNPDHPLSAGALCAVGQTSILGLYDSRRLREPLQDGQETSWEEADRAIIEQLERIRREAGAVRFLTGTIHSPTALAAIDAFLGRFSDARHVAYDAVSTSAILDAHERTHGRRVLPRYCFEKAKVIVSFDADFLGTWISPVEHTVGYQAGRQLERFRPDPSYHVQLESRLTLSGSKADKRIRIGPGEAGPVLAHLVARLAERAGEPINVEEADASPLPSERLEEIAERLWTARGRSLVLCGSQDVELQVWCNFINHLVESYGSTVDIDRPSQQRQGADHDLQALLQDIEEGRIAALFVSGVNPVFDLPGGGELQERLQSVPLVVSLAERLDETAELAHYVCPVPHFLESWGDSEAVAGVVGLRQPCIQPLGNTRPLLESLAAWTGVPQSSYEIVRQSWQERIFPRQNREASFQTFWDRAVHDGVVELDGLPEPPGKPFEPGSLRAVPSAPQPATGELTLVLYPKVGMPDARHAYNAWLHELPDPVSKATWDNYACLSPAAAETLGVGEGDVVQLEATDGELAPAPVQLPVAIQPGQHDQVVAVALGYGGKLTERFAEIGPRWLEARSTVGPTGRVGVNAAGLAGWRNGVRQYAGASVKLTRTGERHSLACTQAHHSITVPEHLAPAGAARRPVVQETTLSDFVHEVRSGEGPEEGHDESLWPQEHESTGHRWGMAIDLNACTGCSACVAACQVENNIPVVGKDEVRRRREMHWIRIDRYYAGEEDELEVAHQPMLCQHCENAPCETVCPVLATVHSEEGLNQQVYNRCVGTRYCANNCPYKVRRFNWFEYAHDEALENLVLNPNVTVRSRGVMEKCSFCVQRIQEAKIEAKRQGRPLRDGDVQAACQQTCPANAIVFGDLSDPNSRVAQMLQSPRRYRVLEEINVRPAVAYLGLVRNGKASEEKEADG